MTIKELIIELHAKMNALQTLLQEEPSLETALPANVLAQARQALVSTQKAHNAWTQTAPIVETPAPPEVKTEPEPAPKPPKTALLAPVGYYGKNIPEDVLFVRQLLNQHGYQLPEVETYDLKLEHAIKDFQLKYCGMTESDYRVERALWADATVDPKKTTWQVLQSGKYRKKADESALAKQKEARLQKEAEALAAKNPLLKKTIDLPFKPKRIVININGLNVDYNKNLTPTESVFGFTVEYPSMTYCPQPRPLFFGNPQSKIIFNVYGEGEHWHREELTMYSGQSLQYHVRPKADISDTEVQTAIQADFAKLPMGGKIARKMLELNPLFQMNHAILFEQEFATGRRRDALERLTIVASSITQIVSVGSGSVFVKAGYILSDAAAIAEVAELKNVSKIVGAAAWVASSLESARSGLEGLGKWLEEVWDKGLRAKLIEAGFDWAKGELIDIGLEELMQALDVSPELKKRVLAFKEAASSVQESMSGFSDAVKKERPF